MTATEIVEILIHALQRYRWGVFYSFQNHLLFRESRGLTVLGLRFP